MGMAVGKERATLSAKSSTFTVASGLSTALSVLAYRYYNHYQ